MKNNFSIYFSMEQIKTPDQKPDWTCPKCGKLNTYSHSYCRGQGCSESKPR